MDASPFAPALPLASGLLLGVAAALLTWRLLPRGAPAVSAVEAADTLPVKPGEAAAWTGKIDLPAWFVTVIASVASVLIALSVLLLLTKGWHLWPIFLTPTLLLLLLALTAQFLVSAGPRGFVARSSLGWPRLSIPASDVAKAGVVSIDPIADFGGWGIRWVIGPSRKGRWGVITRQGAGLEVVRRDGRSIVVTIDDAGTAAAVLETYATKHA